MLFSSWRSLGKLLAPSSSHMASFITFPREVQAMLKSYIENRPVLSGMMVSGFKLLAADP